MPIKSITMKSRNETFKYQGGGDEPGPACVKLLTTLKGIQTGKIEDTFGWTEKVREARLGDYEHGSEEEADGVDVGSVSKLP